MSNRKFVCRMYEPQYPEVEDVVMVNVRQIADMGVYVNLLEYDNIEGMILLSELSRRRIRSVQKLIRIGRNEIVVVVRVDKEKGYIDLSKRRVTPEDIQKCDERYNKSKTVHSVMRHVAEKVDVDLEELYQKIGWPLYRKYGHAYDAFKMAITEPQQVTKDLDVPPAWINQLLDVVRRRLTPQPVKIRTDFELTCFSYKGIDAIKEALKEGEAAGSTEEIPFKVKLVAPPLYVMSASTLDKTKGLEALSCALAKIEEMVSEHEGNITVKREPQVVSEHEEKELVAMLERAERENAEVSGDDDVEGNVEPDFS